MCPRSRQAKTHQATLILFFFFSLLSFAIPSGESAAKSLLGYDPSNQTPALLYDEARTVYLGNLARRDNGIPPLRWNLQLTHAARWFSWDSVENRPDGFCSHQDSLGKWPGDRVVTFGYLGLGGAENAFCGYVTPEYAIEGWMNSPGHRANLLDPTWREIGLGYYRRSSDERGYVTQDFGSDDAYPPVIIENEALSTTNPTVNLYIYEPVFGYEMEGLDTVTQMALSNSANFSGASWESFKSNKVWTLTGGSGWRNVYIKLRDKFNRSRIVTDTIYLGTNIPLNELGAAQMNSLRSKVVLHNLNGGGLPQVQLSLGWLGDNTHHLFIQWTGNGNPVNDTAAWGGTSNRLDGGSGESYASLDDWTLPKDIPLVAYFRLKVSNNSSMSAIARVSVTGGGTEYGPLNLRGIDFKASNQYQEFALPFIYNTNPNESTLTFNFWRTGSADLYVDAVSVFTAPRPITSPLIWSIPGGNYHGQGVWVRYTDGSQFTAISEAEFVDISGQTFADVSNSYWAWSFIEQLYSAGITGGCGNDPLTYCPETIVNRAQMAVFLERGIHGASYNPPAVGSNTGFGDVSTNYWSASWIKQLAGEGITGGCGSGNYCPEAPVTRAQMAIFLLRSKYGADYNPPAVGSSTGFGDVSTTYWAAAWIKQLVAEGITAGCGAGSYCPEAPVTRAQMAVFLVRTFNLP